MKSKTFRVTLMTCAEIAFCLFLAPTNVHAKIKLTPQSVVDYSLNQGLAAKTAALQAQRGYLVYQQALGALDFQVIFTPGYTYDQAQTLAQTNNILDRTLTFDTIVSKKIRTGTTLTAEYVKTQQASILNASTSTGTQRYPNENLIYAQLQVRQELWRNAFGYADRLGLAIGQDTIKAALETREDSLQQVLLDAMTLFWNTYTAEQVLQENIRAQKTYEELLQNVRRKSGYSLAAPGELSRLEAELLGADEKVKTASAAYLKSVDELLTSLQIKTAEEVAIEVPNDLPAIPILPPKSVDELRPLRIARLNQDNAERALRVAKSRYSPQVDVVARGRSTGVDQEPGRASADMTAINYPTYYLGLEVTANLDSDLWRGQIADAQVAYAQTQNETALQYEAVANKLRDAERQVASQYAVAKSSVDIVDLRTRTVRELLAAYRQGRQPLVEVIRAYQDLFVAQADRARSVGDYHISLNRLAAARDELVGNVQ